MSTLALQSLLPLGTTGVGDESGDSSSGPSSQIQQLLAALEQDILKQLSGQNGSGQGDTSGSAPSSSATAGSQDDAGDAGSSGNTQQAMLEDILQVLLQLLQNNGQSQGTGDDQTNSMLADILQIVSQLLEGQGQQSAGSQSGSQPSADGTDAASQSGDSTQSTLEEILLALLQMLEGGQGADTGTDADAGTDAGSQSGGASSDSEILQEITQLLQQLLDGGQNQDGSGATPDSLAARDPAGNAASSGASAAAPDTDANSNSPSSTGATPAAQTDAAAQTTDAGTKGASAADGSSAPQSNPTASTDSPSGPPSGPYVDASKYVDGKSGADQTAGLQAALDEGKRTGEPVYLKAGTYNYSGQLKLDGTTLVGDGQKTVLNATSPTNSAVTLTGDNASLSNLKVQVDHAGTRSSQPQDCAVLVQNASNATVSNVTTQGASANGIRLDNAQHSTIGHNLVQGSNADGIAITNGSSNNVISKNVVYQAGDDGISNDRYQGDAGPLQSNTIDGNLVLDGKYGGGIKDAGGTDTQITNNTVIGVPGKGVYVGADSNSGTLSSSGVVNQGNVVQSEYDETDHAHHSAPDTPEAVKNAIAQQNIQGVLGWNATLTDVGEYNGTYVWGTGAGANNANGQRT